MVNHRPSRPIIVLDVSAFAYKQRTPPLGAALRVQIFAGLCCKSPMNFTSLHPLLVEKANDDSLLVAVQHFENLKRKAFSVKKSSARPWIKIPLPPHRHRPTTAEEYVLKALAEQIRSDPVNASINDALRETASALRHLGESGWTPRMVKFWLHYHDLH
jgi:hypothetical protein